MAGQQRSRGRSGKGDRRPPVHHGRRLARVLALETLYETELAHHNPGDVLERRQGERPSPAQAEAYARELLDGVLRHRRELDDMIQRWAVAWPLGQMAAIDRNILRLGLYESLHRSDTVPVKVAINEAIELAKLFGTENSARFVNGVIGRAVDSTPAESPDQSPTRGQTN